MPSEQEWIDLVRATEMLLTDKIPEAFEPQAIFLPALSKGMIESGNIFKKISLMAGYECDYPGGNPYKIKIIINGSDGRGMPPQDKPRAAWPGRQWYEKEFGKMGVSDIIPTDPMMHNAHLGWNMHTRGEAEALVSIMKLRGWHRLIVVTIPYHLVQVFNCLVKVMDEQEYWFAAYAAAPETNWRTPMVGSQGLNRNTTPFEQAGEYALKIFDYQEKGRSASFDRLFRYLGDREMVGNFR